MSLIQSTAVHYQISKHLGWVGESSHHFSHFTVKKKKTKNTKEQIKELCLTDPTFLMILVGRKRRDRDHKLCHNEEQHRDTTTHMYHGL